MAIMPSAKHPLLGMNPSTLVQAIDAALEDVLEGTWRSRNLFQDLLNAGIGTCAIEEFLMAEEE